MKLRSSTCALKAFGVLMLVWSPAIQAATPVATLDCTSPASTLRLPLLELDLLVGTTYEFSFSTDPAKLPTLLAAAQTNPTYSTCTVTGIAQPFTLTGVSFQSTPGFSGEIAAFDIQFPAATPTVLAVADMQFDTVTIGGVTITASSKNPTLARKHSKEAQR